MRAAVLYLLTLAGLATVHGQYYGEMVASFPNTAVHDVSGTVYIVDSKRIRIRNFKYDGQGPDAYFWAGTTEIPDTEGTIVPDEMMSMNVLGSYMNADVVLTLPDPLTTSTIKSLSVWCRMFGANFGHVTFPGASTCVPESRDIGTLNTYSNGVSSVQVRIVDAKTIRISSFNYDGQGPDAYFLVGTGLPSGSGQKAGVGSDMSMEKLGAYASQDVEIHLPAGVVARDIDWISVWCLQATANFGDIMVPDNLCVPPAIDMMSMMYFGEFMGSLVQKNYEVNGDVFVVDTNRLRLRHFYYSGLGPDAYFYIGIKGQAPALPADGGTYLMDESGSPDKLVEYVDADILLDLPQGVVASQVAWISVWCKSVAVDFGSLVFPDNFAVPAPANLGPLTVNDHISSTGDFIVLDKRRIQIKMFNYDGQGPDAHFLVGTGPIGASTMSIRVPDETGSMTKLTAYTNEDIELLLPGGVTVDDIEWFSVYCIQATVNFGSIMIENRPLSVPPYIPVPAMMANCEVMDEGNFNVAWEIVGDMITFEFSGNIGMENGYMTFGISGADTFSLMDNADPMVVYLENGQPKVQDYYITGRSLCSGGVGVCPDTMMTGGTDDLTMLSGQVKDGVTTVKFRRPLAATNAGSDKAIPASGDTFIVWATGNVNDQFQVTKHLGRLFGPKTVDFGRAAANNCPPIVGTAPEPVTPWKVHGISGQDTKVFDFKIGLSGGLQGYAGITGQVSWGIAWYVNGMMIPELTLKRGETYTFFAQGGNDPTNQARFHPLYITDDMRGGYAAKSTEEMNAVTIFAGTRDVNGVTMGTEGRFCEYMGNENPDNYDTFMAYFDTLNLACDDTSQCAGTFTWTPSAETPDLVYYQCYTHNYLGWKIHIVDEFPDPTPEPEGEPETSPTSEPGSEPEGSTEPEPEGPSEPTAKPGTSEPEPEGSSEPEPEGSSEPAPEGWSEPTGTPRGEPTSEPERSSEPTCKPCVEPTSEHEGWSEPTGTLRGEHTRGPEGPSLPTAQPFKVSVLNQADVEAAMFILVAVCFVLILVVLMLGINYSATVKQLHKARTSKA